MAGDSYELALKRRGNTLTKYISNKLNVPIRLIYAKPSQDCDGQTICPKELIIIYWNQSNWDWLKEVIIHESAHRLDHKYRGPMHHNPKYEHDKNYWRCYKDVLDIVTNSQLW